MLWYMVHALSACCMLLQLSRTTHAYKHKLHKLQDKRVHTTGRPAAQPFLCNINTPATHTYHRPPLQTTPMKQHKQTTPNNKEGTGIRGGCPGGLRQHQPTNPHQPTSPTTRRPKNNKRTQATQETHGLECSYSNQHPVPVRCVIAKAAAATSNQRIMVYKHILRSIPCTVSRMGP